MYIKECSDELIKSLENLGYSLKPSVSVPREKATCIIISNTGSHYILGDSDYVSRNRRKTWTMNRREGKTPEEFLKMVRESLC